MGHQHLGTLPASRKWQQVVALISSGADIRDVAAATSEAAEQQMVDASNDPAVRYSFWLLTQIPGAARATDFASELERLGIATVREPTLLEIAMAVGDAIDAHVAVKG